MKKSFTLLMLLLLSLPAITSGQEEPEIQPYVDCVLDLGNNLYVAYFGYNNSTGRTTLIGHGDDNQVSPEVPQMPPQRFEAGRTDPFPAVTYAVEFDGNEVTWTVKGVSATATPDAPACQFEANQQMSVSPDQPHQTITGFGGAFVHFFSKTPGRGAHDNVSRVNFDRLQPTHVRVGMPLFAWEPSNDDQDSTNFNWSGFADSGLVNDIFVFMQEVEAQNGVILASLWRPADWMITNPDRGREQSLKDGIVDELAESITAWLVYARDNYGVTIDYVSINEPNLGVNILIEEPALFAEIIKVTGARFADAGLTTKWVLGDTSNSADLIEYASPIWADEEVRPYIGILAFHSWDAQVSDTTLTNIAEWSEEIGLDLWVTETGYDPEVYLTPEVFDTWEHALETMRIYSRLYKLAGVNTTFYWQMMDDYRLVSQDGTTPLPAFYALAQLRQMVPPGSQIIETSRNGVKLYTFAAQHEEDFTIHLTNTDTIPAFVTISGIPDGDYRYIRTSAAEPSGAEIGILPTTDDGITLALPRSSINILTTIE